MGNVGQVLLGIKGDHGQPAHNEGWTIKKFDTTPVQLNVGPKPGVYTVRDSEMSRLLCVWTQILVCMHAKCLDTYVHDSCLHSAYMQSARHPVLNILVLQLSKCNKSLL